MSRVKTISFYSFKGGTGRSTALANVSHALAEKGYDVGCMDLDLAAPGLHMIFPDTGFEHANSRSIHDYLLADGDIEDINDINEFVMEVDKEWDNPPEGDLLLISGDIKPPGMDDNPTQAMEKSLSLKDELLKEHDLDYILFDSRSGLSHQMIPVFADVDAVLTFHRWTHQHKTGTKKLVKWMDDTMGAPEMMSVASNVPTSVDESDISGWAKAELLIYNFSDHHIINSSDALKDGEKVVAVDKRDKEKEKPVAERYPVVEQYRGLADKILEL